MTKSQFSTCWYGDSNCPRCLQGKDQNFTLTFLHWDNYQENFHFLNKTNEAHQLMQNIDQRNIIYLDIGPLIHTTFVCNLF